MKATADILKRFSGTHTNVNTTEQTVLQFDTYDGINYRPEKWLLTHFRYVRSGGAAANYQPSIGEVAGYALTDINCVVDFGSTVVGTRRNELIVGDGIPCITDANGRLYFKPGFDAGADNDGDWILWFRRAT